MVQNGGTTLSLLDLISQEMVTHHECAVHAYAIEKKKVLMLLECFKRLARDITSK